MKKVLIAQKIPEEAVNILKQEAEVVFSNENNLDEFINLFKESTAIVLGSSIKLTSELMDLAPQLKVISRTGAGVDNVGIDAATKRKIMVLHTPEANSITVAEHTVALILGISKQLLLLDHEVREGNFKTIRRKYLPVDIGGKTLGLVGYGRIGRMVAEKCIDAFNMKVLVYDPYIKTKVDNVRLVKNIEEVFKNSDFISLHVPLVDETRNLVGEKLLSLMKQTSYLINTARGGIIDEKALAKKLRNEEIAGAAIDVFSSEPPDVTNELLNLSNIIVTPHSAALTNECVVRVALEACRGVIDYLNGKVPRFIFNKEVMK